MSISIKIKQLKINLVKGLVFAVIAFSNQMAMAVPFSDLYVFGDSLSENGNLQALNAAGIIPGGPYPPRFTNGPTATEILAAQMGLVLAPSFVSSVNPSTDGVANNYAVAGGRARDTSAGVFPISTVPNLGQQTGTAIAQSGGVLDANALYLIFMGGNDIGDAVTAGSTLGLPAAGAVVGEAVSGILNSITSLQTFGAQNFLVVNAPDVGATPKINAFGAPAVALANSLVAGFNASLSAAISGMAGVTLFDSIAFSQNYISSGAAAADGITNFTDACSAITPVLCTDNSFFYADPFHVTAPVQAAFGQALIKAVGVPEPSPIALLGLGLMGLMYMRKRTA